MKNIATLIAIGLLSFSAQSLEAKTTAEDAGSALSVRVRFSDLDLSNQDGLATLVERVHEAANAVCTGEPLSPIFNVRLERRKCIKFALDGAAPKIEEAVASSEKRSAVQIAERS